MYRRVIDDKPQPCPIKEREDPIQDLYSFHNRYLNMIQHGPFDEWFIIPIGFLITRATTTTHSKRKGGGGGLINTNKLFP